MAKFFNISHFRVADIFDELGILGQNLTTRVKIGDICATECTQGLNRFFDNCPNNEVF